jgi:hypothetical protein
LSFLKDSTTARSKTSRSQIEYLFIAISLSK